MKCALGPTSAKSARIAKPTASVAAAAASGSVRRETAASTTRPTARPTIAARVCVHIRPAATSATSGITARLRGARSSATTHKNAVTDRREEGRDEATGQLLLVPVVVDEVLRQPREAVPVRVAELLREVTDGAVVPPPVEVDRVDVDQSPGDDRRGDRQNEATNFARVDDERAAEEVGADAREVVAQRKRRSPGASRGRRERAGGSRHRARRPRRRRPRERRRAADGTAAAARARHPWRRARARRAGGRPSRPGSR